MLSSNDPDTRLAAATFLNSPDLTSAYGPVTADKLHALLGITDSDLLDTQPGPPMNPPLIPASASPAIATPADPALLQNLTVAFWAAAALVIAGVCVAAAIRNRTTPV